MTYKSQLGNFGENLACGYLVNNGYKIIDRNFRKPWGEIDIIAKAPDKTLVFIEVKTMEESSEGLKPEDQLTSSKLQKLKRTASLYAGHRQELIDNEKGWRIDLIAITTKVKYGKFTEGIYPELVEGLTIINKDVVIKHYKNIG
ncbi:MAG: YraN family protein [Patescibacteria group bacterium]